MAKTNPRGISTGVNLVMEPFEETQRSSALDAWDFRVPFGRFHISWGEGEIAPAFEQNQAYAIAVQDLGLNSLLEVWGHREALVTFSSPYVEVGGRPAEGEPAWVVMIAGRKREDAPAKGNALAQIAPGGSTIIQVLIHGRTGELLLGTALPVALQRRH